MAQLKHRTENPLRCRLRPHWVPLAGLIFSMHAGMAAAQDANEDAMEQGSLLLATAHAAALSAIPFGIATLGMLVSSQPLSDVLRRPAKVHRMRPVASKS